MKTAKKLVLAVAVLPLTLGTASVFAFGGKDHKRGPDHGFGLDRSMIRQLDLTEEQKEQLKQWRKTTSSERKIASKENFEAHHAERVANKNKLQSLMLAETFDREAVSKLAKQMVEQQTERKVNMLENQHQMLSILTPEQKIKFVELQKAQAEKRAIKMRERISDS
ncbi:CpxP family protein [Vibrio ostreicida]|uniref:CpxP family protein n=1 Tax=Vibrio ostreicida TaxID=526588 RepID=UPI003B596092